MKVFDGLRAVDGVSFEVKEGEVFGFLGPNGAGKTTTVRLITGVLKPDSGTARIGDVDVLEDPIGAKEFIGIAPEESNAYIDMSSLANLNFSGELYGVPRSQRKKRSEELLKKFGLFDRRYSKVKKYSKGMKQRLILAMALINNPPILFLDEPTSGLDVESQQLIKDQIQDLNRQDKTIFLTTHNILEADQLCDRVAIIDKGRIVAIDAPEKLKSTIQSTQSVLISFDSDDIYRDDLETLKEVEEVQKQGDKFRLYTSKPALVVEEIVDLSRGKKLTILSLQTMGPSLEEVFTHLTRN